MKQYLAIDIGGTAVKLGIVDETGAVGPKAEESVNFDGYQTPVLTTVLKAAKAFVETQNIDVNTLEGVGVSATGQIDSRKGIVAGTCGNFPNYINSPIQAELERLFGLPVTVANDANCMTLGEVWVGGAKGYTDVIGVTLGTGVGGGILTGGRLLEGARGLGGELGHYRTHALDGIPCTMNNAEYTNFMNAFYRLAFAAGGGGGDSESPDEIMYSGSYVRSLQSSSGK